MSTPSPVAPELAVVPSARRASARPPVEVGGAHEDAKEKKTPVGVTTAVPSGHPDDEGELLLTENKKVNGGLVQCRSRGAQFDHVCT
jgi:hypothetical protein